MAARATLVLTDRAASPANHNYTPDGDDANGVHVFSEKTGVPIGNPRFTASLRQSGGKYRSQLKLAVPVVQTQTINGVTSPVVVRTAYVDATITFEATSTDQERQDAVGLFASSLTSAQTMINDMIVNLVDIW